MPTEIKKGGYIEVEDDWRELRLLAKHPPDVVGPDAAKVARRVRRARNLVRRLDRDAKRSLHKRF